MLRQRDDSLPADADGQDVDGLAVSAVFMRCASVGAMASRPQTFAHSPQPSQKKSMIFARLFSMVIAGQPSCRHFLQNLHFSPTT